MESQIDQSILTGRKKEIEKKEKAKKTIKHLLHCEGRVLWRSGS